MLMMGDVTEDELYDAFAEQAQALANGGADGLVIETMSDIEEAKIALRACKETGLPVVAIAPRDHVFEKMLGNIQEAKARGGSVIAVTSGSDEGIRDLLNPATDYLVALPTAHRLLTPVVFVLPLQLLAYHIGLLRGCDVDQPRNLAKSVTVE